MDVIFRFCDRCGRLLDNNFSTVTFERNKKTPVTFRYCQDCCDRTLDMTIISNNTTMFNDRMKDIGYTKERYRNEDAKNVETF